MVESSDKRGLAFTAGSIFQLSDSTKNGCEVLFHFTAVSSFVKIIPELLQQFVDLRPQCLQFLLIAQTVFLDPDNILQRRVRAVRV